jgi:phosphate transport system permease protein
MPTDSTFGSSLQARPTRTKALEASVTWVFRLATWLVVAAALYVFGYIGVKGGAAIVDKGPAFLLESPETLNVFTWRGEKYELGDRAYREFVRNNPEFNAREVRLDTYVYSSGGIFPNIVGTLILTVGATAIAMVLGVFSAIYLSEYAKQGAVVRGIRLAILNLAGVPSIVYGLWGYGMFVIAFDWQVSVLAGWFTLAFMVLPIVITASEESLRAVPQGYREGSLALGATKWQSIRKNVLPYALPGMLTSSILAIARVAGETAPIMFTAAFVMRDDLPWQGLDTWTDFFRNGVMALPYHIYVVSAKIPQNSYTEAVQYGTAFVFLFTVAGIAMSSILLRQRLRNKYKW